jgi:hypothetical protein
VLGTGGHHEDHPFRSHSRGGPGELLDHLRGLSTTGGDLRRREVEFTSLHENLSTTTTRRAAGLPRRGRIHPRGIIVVSTCEGLAAARARAGRRRRRAAGRWGGADIGCATGRALPALRAAVGPAATVLGLDVTPEMLQTAAGPSTGCKP